MTVSHRSYSSIPCTTCGRPADTLHLVGDGFGRYPRRPVPSVEVACADHDGEGYWIWLDDLFENWNDWMCHLGGKAWQGDTAIIDWRQARPAQKAAGEERPLPLIYFIQADRTGHVKIGTSVNVKDRLKSLQCATTETLTLLAVTPGTVREEHEHHRRFRHLRLRGEWFDPGADLMDYIATLPGGGGGR